MPGGFDVPFSRRYQIPRKQDQVCVLLINTFDKISKCALIGSSVTLHICHDDNLYSGKRFSFFPKMNGSFGDANCPCISDNSDNRIHGKECNRQHHSLRMESLPCVEILPRT